MGKRGHEHFSKADPPLGCHRRIVSQDTDVGEDVDLSSRPGRGTRRLRVAQKSSKQQQAEGGQVEEVSNAFEDCKEKARASAAAIK